MDELVFHSHSASSSGVWWSPFCGATSPFSSQRFDFTPCFEHTVLEMLPVALLVVLGGWELWRIWSRRSKEEESTGGSSKAALIAKMLLANSIVALQVAITVIVSVDFDQRSLFVSSVVLAVAYAYASFHHLVSHPLLPHSSTPLLFFWHINIFSSAISLRTFLLLNSTTHSTLATLFTIRLVLSITLFAIECLGPDGWTSDQGRIKLGEGPLDESEFATKPCPRLRANIFERFTFSWMSPLIRKGYSKFLSEDDLWDLPPDDTTKALGNRLEEAWLQQQAKKGKTPSLLYALIQAYGGPFFVASIFKLGYDIIAFLQPQLLRRILLFAQSYQTETPEPAIVGYTIAGVMFASAVVQTVLLHLYFSRVTETGLRIRTGLISLLYKKSLILSNDERGGRSQGDIVNLQSTDTIKLQDFCTYAQIGWSGFLQMAMGFVSLYKLLGWTVFVGIGVLFASIPVTATVMTFQSSIQTRKMETKDKRARLTSEILANIRSLKLYAWEPSFAAKLLNVRNGPDGELSLLRKTGYVSSMTGFLWFLIPFLVSFFTFACFSWTSSTPLTSDIVFPAITLFQLLSFPLHVVPFVIFSGVDAWISIGRLSSFLLGKELQGDAVVVQEREKVEEGDELVSVRDGEFSWKGENEEESTLQGIDLNIKTGQLIALIGRVGSGKTSILSALLGEMSKRGGSVTVRGTVAYAAQQPFIMGGTIRENIIFGHELDEKFYNEVLDACALREDLAILSGGDETTVGEKGVSLSGGQKARVSLARAIYSRADIYLLDDPLAAVDAHVGRHLFENVLGPRGLLANKARLLATNAIPYVQEASEIIMLRKGVIIERGTYASASLGESELSRLLAEFGQSEQSAELEREVVDTKAQHQHVIKADTRMPMLSAQEQHLAAHRKLRANAAREDRKVGAVPWQVYWDYIKVNSVSGSLAYIFLTAMQQFLHILSHVVLKSWASHNDVTHTNGRVTYWLSIYFGLGLSASTSSLLAGFVLYSFCIIRASRKIHDGMFSAVLASPMSFFETTPVGAILNRFTQDIYVVDEVLSRCVSGFFWILATLLGGVGVIAISAPQFLLVLVPLLVVYHRVQTYYLASSRELKRLEALSKSPIFSGFQETLNGVSTIRAYRQASRFIVENRARVDCNTGVYFASINTNRWLAVRMEFIGAVIVLATAALAVYSLGLPNGIEPGLIGLMITYALTTTQSLDWLVRSITELETNLVSVERVQQYQLLPPEGLPSDKSAIGPDSTWPQHGEIEFRNVAARYRPGLDLILNDVSFKVEGGQKIGVVGRTGAGKSSLTMVLYRIIETELGNISIDGVDLRNVDLHTLRSRLSIIPQESQCFAGTLKENLDPTATKSDEELWTALEHCRLKEHVLALDGQLEASIEEGGVNLSSGQRQLLCLGRALLRRSKVLILDEATSAVDPESDKAIQTVIRSEFVDCTVITIAHRIETILDCDRVLVMNQGQVAEFAPPSTLLADPSSLFYGLANEAGVLNRK